MRKRCKLKIGRKETRELLYVHFNTTLILSDSPHHATHVRPSRGLVALKTYTHIKNYFKKKLINKNSYRVQSPLERHKQKWSLHHTFHVSHNPTHNENCTQSLQKVSLCNLNNYRMKVLVVDETIVEGMKMQNHAFFVVFVLQDISHLCD